MNYEALSGKTVRLLGKTRSLRSSEFETLLKLHNIGLSSETTTDISLVIEGRMMNPLEQQESDRAYEERVAPIVGIDAIEEWLCRSIEPERLLMSLKLSRDGERLVDFIRNPYITDDLFFKLLKLYDWQGEGLFDNDTNRDVTAAIIGRYYQDIDKNHNVQYAMSGLAHLIERYGTTELINAVAELLPVREAMKNPQERALAGVLDAMALHPQTPRKILQRLLEGRQRLLARRNPLDFEAELLQSGDEEVKRMLSENPSLSAEGIASLEGDYGAVLASRSLLDAERFERWSRMFPKEIASNPSLNAAMQERLIRSGDDEVLRSLAANPALEKRLLEILEEEKFAIELASNPSLKPEKLEALFAKGTTAVLAALASNPSTPVDVLYQLSLDQRYERNVRMNPSFGKYIQTHNIGWQP